MTARVCAESLAIGVFCGLRQCCYLPWVEYTSTDGLFGGAETTESVSACFFPVLVCLPGRGEGWGCMCLVRERHAHLTLVRVDLEALPFVGATVCGREGVDVEALFLLGVLTVWERKGLCVLAREQRAHAMP